MILSQVIVEKCIFGYPRSISISLSISWLSPNWNNLTDRPSLAIRVLERSSQIFRRRFYPDVHQRLAPRTKVISASRGSMILDLKRLEAA